MAEDRIIRIANGQGFWGDSQLGPIRLVEEGPLDYLTFDYLAEITMSILHKQKMRDPAAGYARDFISTLKEILPACREKNIKIIANAAGVNPRSCMQAIEALLQEMKLSGFKVAMVEGDDIMDRLDHFLETGERLENMETGASLRHIRNRVTSANVYLGARPVVEALEAGADIIVTGRVSDPALVLAPLIYEFGWSFEDYDLMAAGTIMGHIIECGPQCTGGNFTEWQQIEDFANIGYPVVEAHADGSFVVTKHAGTGGLVSRETVISQLLYELGDPSAYISPDCIADFTSLTVEQDGKDRVRVSGVRGYPATPTYKVSISYANGYKILGTLSIAGPDAEQKAHILADMLWKRAERLGCGIPEDRRFLELFGTHVLYRGLVPPPEQPYEILMRIGARGEDRADLNRIGMELAPLITSGPPGVTGFAGGRPRASEVIGYWPALLPKELVTTSVTVKEV